MVKNIKSPCSNLILISNKKASNIQIFLDLICFFCALHCAPKAMKYVESSTQKRRSLWSAMLIMHSSPNFELTSSVWPLDHTSHITSSSSSSSSSPETKFPYLLPTSLVHVEIAPAWRVWGFCFFFSFASCVPGSPGSQGRMFVLFYCSFRKQDVN